MRFICFKGKNIKTGKWTCGFYFCMYNNDEPSNLHHFIIPEGYPLPKNKAIGEIRVEIDPETLCQYTEADDIDGNRIFDGDIIDIETPSGEHKIGAVAWVENAWRVFTKEDYLRDLYDYVPGADEVKVIGDRFDYRDLWNLAFKEKNNAD